MKIKGRETISVSPLQRILDMDLSPNGKYLATTSEVNVVFPIPLIRFADQIRIRIQLS